MKNIPNPHKAEQTRATIRELRLQTSRVQKLQRSRESGPAWIILLILALLLAACQTSDAAADSVEAYLNALANKQPDALTAVSCADWEEQALIELSAFGSVDTTLDGLDCQVAGSEGDDQLVACQGKIIASYNDEAQEFPLDRRQYRVRSEGGEWRVCGYK
jgi:hypothetical protein